jgi:hypothetical protein
MRTRELNGKLGRFLRPFGAGGGVLALVAIGTLTLSPLGANASAAAPASSAGASIAHAFQSPHSTPASELPAGSMLTSGQSLISENGTYQTIMQADGNLVTYQGAVYRWQSATDVAGSYVVMQNDGNLVIYSPSNQPVFLVGTAISGHNTMLLGNDGNLVMYSWGILPLWSSFFGFTGYTQESVPAGGFMAANQGQVSYHVTYFSIMQTDGNFVVYTINGTPVWDTGTDVSGSTVVMQSDGNLVVYAPGGVTPLWNSQTSGAGTQLVMQDDGNLVIYGANGALWDRTRGKL